MGARLLLLLLCIAVASCQKQEAPVTPPEAGVVRGVQTGKVEVESFTDKDVFSGVVVTEEEIMLSPKVVGYLISLKANTGDQVKKGKILAVIDSSDIKPGVEKARAGLKEVNAALKEIEKALEEVKANRKAVEARLRFMEKTYQRFKNLLQEEAVSKQRFDEVEMRYKATKAQLEAVQAKQEQLRQRKKVLLAKKEQIKADLKKASAYLSYTYLKAPVDGVILQKFVDEGNLVSPQTPVFRIGAYPLKVKAYIDSTYASKVKVGQHLPVKVGNLKLTGIVTEVEGSADPVSHKFGVELKLEPAPGIIPGAYATVEIPATERERLVIPASAVRRVGALEYVFVVENGVARLRLVKTGEKVGGKVTVLSGLRKGETVVVSGVGKLKDGARIEG